MAYPDEYMFYSNYYRGLLISSYASLEMAIEFYIAGYFCGNTEKNMQMTSIVLSRMNFEAKRAVYRAILINIAESNGFVPTKKGYKFNPHLNEISELCSIRNIFAHYFPVVPGSANGSVITLSQFKDSKRSSISYTKEEMDEMIQRIHRVRDEVGEII